MLFLMDDGVLGRLRLKNWSNANKHNLRSYVTREVEARHSYVDH